MRPRPRAELGRLGGGPTRAYGPLGVEFLAGSAPGRPFSVLRVVMRPGAAHPLIRHARTEELFVVLRGSVDARLGGRRRRLGRGDYARLPPGTPHSFRAGRRGVEVLAVFSPPLDPDAPDVVPA